MTSIRIGNYCLPATVEAKIAKLTALFAHATLKPRFYSCPASGRLPRTT
jgi:hypothetical protein